MSDPAPLLETHELTAFYGDFQALFGIDLTMAAGETVAIIGANGAGKSTFLGAVAGLLPSPPGSVLFDGEDIAALPADRIVGRGIALVPEGRRLFASLTVEENLLVGSHGGRAGPWTLARVYELFPLIAERRHAAATSLSGGEQQMAAVGRALMANPRLLLWDEVSLGLAPIVIRDIYAALPEIRRQGATIVIVEQDIGQAMRVADRVYCFQEGRVSLTGARGELDADSIRAAYFGARPYAPGGGAGRPPP
jgi:branched-chain amino acid transport system ATP-binding protein